MSEAVSEVHACASVAGAESKTASANPKPSLAFPQVSNPTDSLRLPNALQPYSSGYENRYGDCLVMIMDYLALTARRENVFCRPHKYLFTNLALVCRRWSFILRPLLFRRLKLWTLADVNFLVETLRSPVSGWLRGSIVSLMLEEFADEDAGVFKQPTWLPLLDDAAALKALCVRTRLGAETKNLFWEGGALYSHSAARTLQHLALSGTGFKSFEALCRFVGGFDSLRGVYFERVVWEVPTGEDVCGPQYLGDRISRLKGGFASLEMICAEKCTHGATLAWMLVAASLRYEGAAESLDSNHVPRDLLAITTMLCAAFNEYDLNVVARRVLDQKGAYTFSMQLAEDQDTRLLQGKHSTVTFVTRPSSSVCTSSPEWTLQHLVITCGYGPIAYGSLASVRPLTEVEQLLLIADSLLDMCVDLQTVEVLYSSTLVDEEDLAIAKSMVRKCMPKAWDKVQ